MDIIVNITDFANSITYSSPSSFKLFTTRRISEADLNVTLADRPNWYYVPILTSVYPTKWGLLPSSNSGRYTSRAILMMRLDKVFELLDITKINMRVISLKSDLNPTISSVADGDKVVMPMFYQLSEPIQDASPKPTSLTSLDNAHILQALKEVYTIDYLFDRCPTGLIPNTNREEIKKYAFVLYFSKYPMTTDAFQEMMFIGTRGSYNSPYKNLSYMISGERSALPSFCYYKNKQAPNGSYGNNTMNKDIALNVSGIGDIILPFSNGVAENSLFFGRYNLLNKKVKLMCNNKKVKLMCNNKEVNLFILGEG